MTSKLLQERRLRPSPPEASTCPGVACTKCWHRQLRQGAYAGIARCRQRVAWRPHLPHSVLGITAVLLASLARTCQAAGWTDATMSVMTGSLSTYPTVQNSVVFPNTLKKRYKQPNAWHPKLRFWFTPDTFERVNTADGTAVSSWTNVANYCYVGHASAECTAAKIAAGENMASEALKQSSAGSQPIYKQGIVNMRGAVRFSRTAVDGTAGKFLQMETTAASNTAGFTSNPFGTNKYTILLVARTVPGVTDTGKQGILHLAKAAADASTQGLGLYKDSVVCESGGGTPGLGCSGTACTSCTASKYTTFGAFSATFGDDGTDDNSCTSACSGGCSMGSPPSVCSNAWGPANAQTFQDPDEWHVIVLQADGTSLKGYIDGYHASSQAPISVTASAAATIAQMRLGLYDQANEANSGFGNVDIAELMIYDAALTLQEIDRIGYYLGLKFGIQAFRLNADVGSIYRTAAVSKNCGCSTGPPWITCDNTKGPYCEVGVSLASGSCQRLDQILSVSTGSSYLDLKAGGTVKSPSTGGNWISIKGQFLLPSDVDVNAASGVFGTANYATLDSSNSDMDTVLTSQYLAVSIGHVPYACKAPFSTVRCLDSDYVETFMTQCRIATIPSAGTVDGASACSSWVAPSPIPEIRCVAPAGVGSGQDLIIYWHGVATVLSKWFHYEAPVIQAIAPMRVRYTGNEIITIKGLNFGPKSSYTERHDGGSQSRTYKAEVILLSRKQMSCIKTTWVSDQELLCEVPPMPPTKSDVDSNGKTSQVYVVVEVLGIRSKQSGLSQLTYTNVPAYYACDNGRVNVKAVQKECFKCCRSACIVDEFANGAKKAGFTYTYCDKSCYKYCGYFSGRGRRLLNHDPFPGHGQKFLDVSPDKDVATARWLMDLNFRNEHYLSVRHILVLVIMLVVIICKDWIRSLTSSAVEQVSASLTNKANH